MSRRNWADLIADLWFKWNRLKLNIVYLNKWQFKVRGFQVYVCSDYVFLGCDTMQSCLMYTSISEEGVTSHHLWYSNWIESGCGQVINSLPTLPTCCVPCAVCVSCQQHWHSQNNLSCLFSPYNGIIVISNLSNNRSKASSKTIPPHSAI